MILDQFKNSIKRNSIAVCAATPSCKLSYKVPAGWTAEVHSGIETGRELTDEIVEKLSKAIADYKESHSQYFGVAE